MSKLSLTVFIKLLYISSDNSSLYKVASIALLYFFILATVIISLIEPLKVDANVFINCLYYEENIFLTCFVVIDGYETFCTDL